MKTNAILNRRLVYSNVLFNKQMARQKWISYFIGLVSILIIWISYFLTLIGMPLKDYLPMALGNILSIVALGGLSTCGIILLLVISEHRQAKESYIISDGRYLAYHVLKSRNTTTRIREVFHIYHIARIDTIIETNRHYIITGDIERMEQVNNKKDTYVCSHVKIPKYFSELSVLLKYIFQNYLYY